MHPHDSRRRQSTAITTPDGGAGPRSKICARGRSTGDRRRRPGLTLGRMWVFAGSVILLAGTLPLSAQVRTASASLLLQVRPEAALQVQNNNVAVKIRLERGVTAQLWAAYTCASAPAASFIITASGTYSIPTGRLMPVTGASRVCLESSDGALRGSQPLGALGGVSGAATMAPESAIVVNGVAVEVPDGWAVTRQAGMTTWSKP